MTKSAALVLGTIVLAASAAGCDPDAQASSPSEGEALGEAEEALCRGYVVANVVPREGSSYFISPHYLLDSAEAWGPQTLLLAVDRAVESRISIERSPSVQIEKKKLTKSLQDSLGYSLAKSLELTASSSTVVPEGAYRRLEAYPTFQRITWDLWQDACGPLGAAHLASGAVFRPFGVYFRVVELVRAPEGEGPEEVPPSITAISSPIVGAEAAGIIH